MNDEKIPIWISDYVLMGYGTGAIMAVPAHDERDYEFAKKFGLEIREVISSDKGIAKEAFIGEGTMMNSGAVHRNAIRGRPEGDCQMAGSEGPWPRHRQLQAARLGIFTPALLGRADSDRSLRVSAVWFPSTRRICLFGCPMSNDISRREPANRRWPPFTSG